MQKLLFLGCFLLCRTAFFAQTPDPESIRLDNLYAGTLATVLEEVSQKTGIRFEFDRAKLGQATIVHRATDVRNLLRHICREHDLKYYFGPDGTVHLVGKYERVDTQNLSQKQAHTGPPTARNFTMSGTVKDAQSGESLPFASVGVRGTSIGASTNVDGYFTLLGVPTDTCALTISYLGYETLTVFLSPETPKTGLTLELEPAGQGLAEIVVTAEREDLLQTNGEQVSMIKMSSAKIATLPNVGERDILRAFQLMPGISAANENSSGLYVRGGTPDQNLTLYDGVTVYHVDHLFGFFSAFNPNAVKDVQLYKGGFPAKFGGRLSSVAEMTGKEGNQRTAAGGFDIGLLSANAYYERPFGDRWAVLLAARRSWKSPLYNQLFERFAGETEAPRLPGGGGGLPSFASTVKSYFYDLNGKLTFRPTSRDILSLSLYNGTDKMDNSTKIELPSFGGGDQPDIDFGITDLTKWGNSGASFKWSRRWGERFYSNALVGYSQYFSERDRSAGGSFVDDDGTEQDFRRGTLENNDLRDLTGKVDFEYKTHENNQLDFGLQFTQNRIAYTYAQNDTSTLLDRDEAGLTSSAYLQDKLKLANGRLTLQPGLRVSQFSATQKWYAEPRLSATFKINNSLKINAAAGQFYQFANRVVREDILQGSRDFWILADGERVPVGSAQHYIAGLSWENSAYLFSMEGYRKNLQGLTEYSLRYSVVPGQDVSYDENFYNGTGYAEGIEWLAQRKFGNLTGWASYTLGRVRYNFAQYGAADFPANQDVTHETKLVAQYRWRRFDFSAT